MVQRAEAEGMTMDARAWSDRVAARLAARAALFERLGEEAWPLEPPLAEADVAAFEAEHGVCLPDDYRAFITRVGASGPGPHYGLQPLAYRPFDAMPSVSATLTTKSGETFTSGTGARAPLGRPSRLDEPFPLDAHWVPVDPQGAPVAPPVPAEANLYDGLLPLADIGCGYFEFLIVSGPRRGEVGVDYTAGAGSIGPNGQTFRAWYDAWLEAQLRYAVDTLVQGALEASAWEVDPALAAHVGLFEQPLADPPSDALRLAGLARLRHYLGDSAGALDALAALRSHPAGAHHVASIEAVCYADDLARAGGAEGLSDLVSHPSLEVRARLAENPHIDPPSLARLARDEAPRVLHGVASHPGAPAEALESLARRAAEVLAGPAPAEAAADHLVLVDVVARRADLPAAARQTLDAFAAGASPGASVAARSLTHRADATLAELEAAAAHEAPWVRHAAAVHPASPPHLVARLAADEHWAVCMGAAGDPSCPPSVLAALAEGGTGSGRTPSQVIAAVARNPSTPADTLWSLAYALGEDHVYALCRNPALPEGVMLAMVLLDRSNVLGLWERPTLPDAVREALLTHHGDYIRRESAQRSTGKNPPFVGARGWWDLPPDAPVRDALGVSAGDRHPSYPRALLGAALARAGATNRPTEAMSLVEAPWADEALLTELAAHSYAYTRAAVAAHPLATEALLAALADDPVAMVRAAAAADPRTPREHVAALVADGDKAARSGVAKNPRAERAWLERLIADEDRWVRRDAALNPRATAEMVAQVAAGEDAQVLAQLAQAPAIGAELLAALADHDDPGVRAAARWRLDGDAFRAARGA